MKDVASAILSLRANAANCTEYRKHSRTGLCHVHPDFVVQLCDAYDRYEAACVGLVALAEWLASEIAKIEADPRYHYEAALVQVNAPLALIQVEMKARKQVLEEAERHLLAIIEPKGEVDATD